VKGHNTRALGDDSFTLPWGNFCETGHQEAQQSTSQSTHCKVEISYPRQIFNCIPNDYSNIKIVCTSYPPLSPFHTCNFPSRPNMAPYIPRDSLTLGPRSEFNRKQRRDSCTRPNIKPKNPPPGHRHVYVHQENVRSEYRAGANETPTPYACMTDANVAVGNVI